MRHPELFRSVAEHLVGPVSDQKNDVQQFGSVRGLQTFTPQGLGNLAWSFAKQATISVEIFLTPDEPESNGNINGNNGRLAVYETSCLDLGETLVTRLFASIAEACLLNKAGLKNFKPQDLSNVIWSFATLGLLHTGLFTGISEEAVERYVIFLPS